MRRSARDHKRAALTLHDPNTRVQMRDSECVAWAGAVHVTARRAGCNGRHLQPSPRAASPLSGAPPPAAPAPALVFERVHEPDVTVDLALQLQLLRHRPVALGLPACAASGPLRAEQRSLVRAPQRRACRTSRHARCQYRASPTNTMRSFRAAHRMRCQCGASGSGDRCLRAKDRAAPHAMALPCIS